MTHPPDGLTALVALLANQPGLPGLLRTDLGVLHEVPEPEAYVKPNLETREGDPSSAGVILISAPAAVGKSMLARHLASQTGSPLWDLGQFRVGSNFFTGTIARAYGGAGYARLDDLIREQRDTLVIDAADEALVRAGVSNYEEAIRDLAELIPRSPGRNPPTAVVLGRPETLELTAVLLDEAGVEWAIEEIGFFDELHARELIERRYRVEASRNGVTAAATGRSSNAGISDFTDVVFQKIHDCLPEAAQDWSSPDVRSFLGYAPVLDALARLAASSGNPFAEAQQLAAEDAHQSVWKLLDVVVESICTRETGKLQESFGGGDPARIAAISQSYSMLEQVRLLLQPRIADIRFNIPETLPRDAADELVASATQQLREHPFLRFAGAQSGDTNPLRRFTNVAFREFVVARALSNPKLGVANAATAFYTDAAVSPSPLLIRMFIVNPPASPVHIEVLGPLLDSAATELSVERRLSVDVREDLDPASSEEAQSAVATVTVAEADAPATEFTCTNDQRGLRLARQIGGASIDLPSSNVTLGAGIRDFSMVAPVFVRAATLTVEADDVRIAGRGNIILDAQRLFSSTSTLRVAGKAANLGVVVPDAPFPWHSFRASAAVDTEAQLVAGAMELRRVVSWFGHRSILGGHRFPVRGMDIIRRKQRTSESMFTYALEQGLIEREGEEYVFDASFDVDRLKRLDLTDVGLRSFLEGFINWVGADRAAS